MTSGRHREPVVVGAARGPGRRAARATGAGRAGPRWVVTGTPCSSWSAASASGTSVGASTAAWSSAIAQARPTTVTGCGRLPVQLLDLEAEPLTAPAGREVSVADLFVQRDDGVDQRFRTRRATRRVHVDGDDLIDALHDGVVVEHATGACTDPHGDDPLGLHHLVVDLPQHGCHLLADPTGHDHEVGLAGRRTERLHPESGDVVVRATGAHHLERAARQTEGSRHHRHARPHFTRSSSLPVRKLWSSPSRPFRDVPLHQAASSSEEARAALEAHPLDRGAGGAVGRHHRREAVRTFFAGPQSRAPLLSRYTNDTSTATVNRRISASPNGPEVPVDDGPGVQEDDLDVEDDEDHRDQVEAHREALGRLATRHDAALVGRALGDGGGIRRGAGTPPG